MSASAIAVPGSVQRDLPPSDPISTERSRQAQPSSGTETDRVAVLAYSLWQRRGCPEGQHSTIGWRPSGNYLPG